MLGPQPLLQLAIRAFAGHVAFLTNARGPVLNDSVDRACNLISQLPAPELALQVWNLLALRSKLDTVPENLAQRELSRTIQFVHEVVRRVASSFAVFWSLNPLRLRSQLAIGSAFWKLITSKDLRHLELQCYIDDLSFLQEVPGLKCLKLCTPAARLDISGLGFASQLEVLEVVSCRDRGRVQLGEDAAASFAALDDICVLTVTGCEPGDSIIQGVSHGVASGGKEPCLQRLVMRDTSVTAHGLRCLELLHHLTLLDLRGTGIRRKELMPLEQRGRLKAMQGCMLAASLAEAALLKPHVPSHRLSLRPGGQPFQDFCACGHSALAGSVAEQELQQWSREGAGLLAELLSEEPRPAPTRTQAAPLDVVPQREAPSAGPPPGGSTAAGEGPGTRLESKGERGITVGPAAGRKRRKDANAVQGLSSDIVDNSPSNRPAPASRKNLGPAFVDWKAWQAKPKKSKRN